MIVDLGRAVHVVGIHVERLGELRGGAGELAQHEDPVLVRARRDELLRHQIHAVPQGRDQHDGGRTIERHQLPLG